MPLIKSRSKKALQSNIETEMKAHPDEPKKNLAIAFSVKRHAPKKKMAEGGPVSAKTEKRPSPDSDSDERQERDAKQKPPGEDSWASRPDTAQSQSNPKPKLQPINDTKMASSSVIHAHRIDALGQRLDRMEKHLQASAAPAAPTDEPPQADNEDGADRQGPSVPALSMKKMASGGMLPAGTEDDGVEHPAGLESDDDSMRPPSPEYMSGYMAGRMAAGGTVESGSPDMNMADGGIMDGELEDEKHSSIAAAIMAKRHKMAEGGEVDLSMNADEEPNHEDQESFEALKRENYSETPGLDELGDQPEDSNEIGDEREDDEENKNDKSITSKIRAKKRQA